MGTFQQKTAAKGTGEEDLLPVFAALFQGIAANAIKGDVEQYRQFRAKMQRVADLDGVRASVGELTMKSDAALNFLQHHCERANDYFLSQISELRSVIELLVGTLADLAIAKPENMRQLQDIVQQIQAAAGVDPLRQRKADLTQCLAEIRRSAERRIDTAADVAARDPVTNLACRPAAEAALAEACASSSPVCAVILMLDRLGLYNQRYGREVGDKTVRFFSDFLVRSFACRDTLFRWTGPALLMLRPGQPDKVQPEVRRVLEPRLQYDCDAGSRTVLLSVDALWSVLPMMVDPRMLVNKIDAFVKG